MICLDILLPNPANFSITPSKRSSISPSRRSLFIRSAALLPCRPLCAQADDLHIYIYFSPSPPTPGSPPRESSPQQPRPTRSLRFRAPSRPSLVVALTSTAPDRPLTRSGTTTLPAALVSSILSSSFSRFTLLIPCPLAVDGVFDPAALVGSKSTCPVRFLLALSFHGHKIVASDHGL